MQHADGSNRPATEATKNKNTTNPIKEGYVTHRAMKKQTWLAIETHHLMPTSGAAVGPTSGCSLLQLQHLLNLGGGLAGGAS